MIQPSALNVVVIGCSVLIFMFIIRTIAAKFSDKPIGQALAVIA